MITLHYLRNSRAQRIVWMLEELGLNYRVEIYERDAKTSLAPDSLKAIHPLGKSPVIEDDGKVIAESGAIIDYLAEKYGADSLLPARGSEAFEQYRYWLHYAEGSLMPLMVIKLLFDKAMSQPIPFFIKPLVGLVPKKLTELYLGPNLSNNLAFVEAHLASQEWFAGEQMTAADVQMSFPLEAFISRNADDAEFPNIRRFVAAVHARPAYQKALENCGSYDYA